MNAKDGLERIRERLIQNDAQAATLDLVDSMIARASAPGADRAQASQVQLVRLLIRTPVASNNYAIYNDLVKLEAELAEGAAKRAAELEAEAARPLPKSRKYYRELKEKQKRGH
jgi:hypothetical protein